MNHTLLLAIATTLGLAPSISEARPKKKPKEPISDTEPKPAQKEADRFFKSGVALYKEAKYSEALAEFQRAYEIAPHPLVLYNIAGCHRELSQYAEAVKAYSQFLAEGKGQVPAARLTAAQTELDSILARIARVTVTVTPDGATLLVDGSPIGTLVEMPLILSPGEHLLVAQAPGRKDMERRVRVASGDELTVDLNLLELPPEPLRGVGAGSVTGATTASGSAKAKRFGVGAGFGTNLRRVGETGAPSVGIGVSLGSRLEIGADVVIVAYTVMPSVRVRVAGSALSLHVVGAVPISFTDGEMSETFVAGAIGLGLRYRPVPGFAVRLETFASFAGKDHGMT
ncbi:MAG: PEGA domain-containing protein, partial [Deltaproteobacteria bacterium]|nr:PEGA domain-containing protein [Deltaproteobacteria bacterium]